MKTLKNKFKKCFIKIEDFIRTKVFVGIEKIFKFIGKYTGISFLLGKYNQKVPNKIKKYVTGYLFIAIWLIGLSIFAIQPIIQSIRMALSESTEYEVEFDEYDNAHSVLKIDGFSLTQFKEIFSQNPDHLETVISTFLDILVVVPIVLIFSLLLSLLLNNKIKGIKIFRIIFFIPVILLSGNLLGYFQTYDLLTVPALESLELQSILSFYFPDSVVEIIQNIFGKIILILWFSGVQTLIFLAGLQKNNDSTYEAASIDGASKWEMFWKITFPTLMPLININIVYTTVIYSNIDNGLTNIISTTIESGTYGRDYASALAWILFLIEVLVIAIYLLVFKLANRKYK